MNLKVITTVLLGLAVLASYADPINITVSDGKAFGTNSWYYNTSEDQEVEPGMVATQAWDLEAFMLDGSNLSVVGGFNFKNGYSYGGQMYYAGDIFIDLDGDANSTNIASNYGYEYVIDINYSAGTYDVVSLTTSASFDQGVTAPNGNYDSRPYRYISGGDILAGMDDLAITYSSGNEYGFIGTTHYEAGGINLAFLSGQSYDLHTTLSCGNDMMKGHVSVPEPGLLSLLGIGLLAVAGLGRKKRKN